MQGCINALLTGLVLGLSAGFLHADLPAFDDPPRHLEARELTQQEKDRREALHQFGLGLLCERSDSLFEALDAFARSGQLDPEAAAAFKEQIPLLLALDRDDEALAISKKALALDEDDYEVWYIYARQLKKAGKVQQMRSALLRGLAAPAIKTDPRFALQMLLDLAMLYEEQEAYLEAADAFARAAHILDDSEAIDFGPYSDKIAARRAAEIHERIGKMYSQAERYADALAAYKRAQERFPDDAGRLNYNLAQIAQKQNKIDQALAYLDSYLRMQPQGIEAYQQRIELLHKLERQGEIVPWLEQCIKADAHNVSVKLLLARQYTQFDQGPAAEKLLLSLGEDAPAPEVYQSLFDLYGGDKGFPAEKGLALVDDTLRQAQLKKLALEPTNAIRQAKAMIAALRADEKAARQFVQAADRQVRKTNALCEQTLHVLGALAVRQERFAEAERFYRAALKVEHPDQETMSYAGLLQVLWKVNKHEEIERICRDGVRSSNPKNHVLLYNDLAKVLTRLERFEEALASVDKANKIADEQEQLSLRHLRARILIHARQFTQAEAECQAMLKEYHLPGEVLEVRYLLSIIYSSTKNLAKAEEQLEAVLALDPNNATACNDLGYIWADHNKNLDRAEELIKKALDLDRRRQDGADAITEKAAYIDSLGWLFYRQGKFEAALRELEKATRLPDGADPTIWDHLGDVYQQLNRGDDARNAWQHALELYDQQKRSRIEERYEEIQRKLKK